MFEGSSPSSLHLTETRVVSMPALRQMGRMSDDWGVMGGYCNVQNTWHGMLLRVQSVVNSRREAAHSGRSTFVRPLCHDNTFTGEVMGMHHKRHM